MWSWSPLAREVVSGLLADLPHRAPECELDEAIRLDALPIGYSLWAWYGLRANGEVVVIGDDPDFPEATTLLSESKDVLRTLVWGTELYPELKLLLPVRRLADVDCQCRTIPIPVFAEGRVLCPECSGLGWLPNASDALGLGLDFEKN